MRHVFFGPPILAVSLLISMCGGSGKPGTSSTPVIAAKAPTAPLAAPTSTVAVPTPDVSWTPVSVGADRATSLAAALRDRKHIGVVVAKAADARDLEVRLDRMIKAVAPETAVTILGREAVPDTFLAGRAPISYRGTSANRSVTGESEAPTYLSKNGSPAAAWRSKKGPLKDLDGVLVVRSVKLDDVYSRSLQEPKTGGCEELDKALVGGLEGAVAYFASFEAGAAQLLGREFSRQLLRAMPFWREELKQTAEIAASGSQTARCAMAYDRFLDKYDPCLKGPCKLGPRVFAVEGLAGMPDESALIPDVCPAEGMRDYADALRDVGDRAFSETLPLITDAWNGEMLRVEGLRVVRDGMSDICSPRVRRLREDDSAAARRSLDEFLVELGAGVYQGTWEHMGGQERIVGVGPVRVLARVKATLADPRVQAASLIKQMRTLNRCNQGTGRLLQISLVAPKTSEVLYMDIFYEEPLLCEDVPPSE